MKRIIICAVASLLASSAALGQTASQQAGSTKAVEQEIRAMEEQRRQAILRNDVKALDRLLAPELATITSLNAGKITTKAHELRVNESETRKLQSWEPSNVDVRVYGNVGLVTGLAEIKDVLRGDTRHIVVQYTHVWVKRDGSWQLVHRHTNRVSTNQRTAPVSLTRRGQLL